uniref:Uncharacterized protein n=1 Tax=Meloidogyne enterolobii TaxID=390850 RepID=A0A6V7UKE9_MELEN|nr:unnamed protein product [Meloidogyne enterolobii]
MSATNAEQKPAQPQKRAHAGEENGADDGIANKTKKVDNGEINKNDLANTENNLKASEAADNEAISAEPKLTKKTLEENKLADREDGGEESDAESGAVDEEEEDDEVLDDDEEDDDDAVGAEGDDQDDDEDGGEDDEGEEEEEEE